MMSWKGPEKSVNSVWQLTVSKDWKGLQWRALEEKQKHLKAILFKKEKIHTK